jgi:putative ABC transport system permease protein
VDSLVNDARSVLRALTASPAVAALAVLCLGIGIGANTMIFAVVDGVLLEPPPFADPDRLVSVGAVNRLASAVELPGRDGGCARVGRSRSARAKRASGLTGRS